MKGQKNMVKKSLHEYWESLQNPDDIYSIYREYKKKFAERQQEQAAGEYLLNEAAAAITSEIKKAFSKM